MSFLRVLSFALLGLSLAACRRHIYSEEKPAAALALPAPPVQAAEAKPADPPAAINIHVASPKTEGARSTQLTVMPATLPPTMPAGMIEMSGFKPFQEKLGNITKIKADQVALDATGKMTLRGNVLVEVKQGLAISRLTSDEISIQTGPGFSPEINGQVGQAAAKN